MGINASVALHALTTSRLAVSNESRRLMKI